MSAGLYQVTGVASRQNARPKSSRRESQPVGPKSFRTLVFGPLVRNHFGPTIAPRVCHVRGVLHVMRQRQCVMVGTPKKTLERSVNRRHNTPVVRQSKFGQEGSSLWKHNSPGGGVFGRRYVGFFDACSSFCSCRREAFSAFLRLSCTIASVYSRGRRKPGRNWLRNAPLSLCRRGGTSIAG